MPKSNISEQSKKPPLPISLTTGRAAAHCHVTTQALKRWIRQGKLRVFRTVGGHARIALEDFQRFLREHAMPPYPPPAPDPGILIVDDEPLMVGLLVDLVMTERPDLKLETAMDGYEALIKVGSFRPALLVLDVMMPTLDGIAVTRHLKANPETREIKILGVTGHRDLVEPLLAAGADACLAKPLDMARVRRELDRLVPPAGA
ncbi:MAG: response regulator [Candidatus Rokubacteria bacterium]|nr:response regulator [Candidatus Rokubacteria bacterium]